MTHVFLHSQIVNQTVFIVS